jgi:hypothetical protein
MDPRRARGIEEWSQSNFRKWSKFPCSEAVGRIRQHRGRDRKFNRSQMRAANTRPGEQSGLPETFSYREDRDRR